MARDDRRHVVGQAEGFGARQVQQEALDLHRLELRLGKPGEPAVAVDERLERRSRFVDVAHELCRSRRVAALGEALRGARQRANRRQMTAHLVADHPDGSSWRLPPQPTVSRQRHQSPPPAVDPRTALHDLEGFVASTATVTRRRRSRQRAAQKPAAARSARPRRGPQRRSAESSRRAARLPKITLPPRPPARWPPARLRASRSSPAAAGRRAGAPGVGEVVAGPRQAAHDPSSAAKAQPVAGAQTSTPSESARVD
jgi:hypothetical protein